MRASTIRGSQLSAVFEAKIEYAQINRGLTVHIKIKLPTRTECATMTKQQFSYCKVVMSQALHTVTSKSRLILDK